MSFPIALQSAVFYFVACTPCAKARHRQKAKDKAKKEREAKAQLEMDQPGLYRHPSPFNTNPFWQEEIQRGPALPKKSNSKNSSQRGLASSGREDSAISVLEHTNNETSRTNVDLVTPVPEEQDLADDWNKGHGYQREDEELWGQRMSGQKWKDAFSKARDSAGRLIESTLGIDTEKEVTEEERHNFYQPTKNPPVNDYHPPVVRSKPEHLNAHKWMLQPPPSAKVMEGKIPVSRAVSSASLPSRSIASRSVGSGDDVTLGRLVNEKLARQRSQTTKENEPTEEELIESLFATRTRSFRRSFDDSEGSAENPFEKRKNRLQPRASPAAYDSSDDEIIPSPLRRDTGSSTTQSLHVVQRPALPTILSAASFESRRSSVKRSRRQHRSDKLKALSGTASPVGDDTD